ncbi:hypothetical protein UFOVP116_131 [uncultured Caudovirales phage]|uniref:Uncharacterized protein n=1 Tax=uncultured Caudovirales phage TaxID=2100421 RepID=A0A6J5L924_9CAUD|nr:hypothetical protein UFOVP116_131 [uncultured Caudovirales phage]
MIRQTILAMLLATPMLVQAATKKEPEKTEQKTNQQTTQQTTNTRPKRCSFRERDCFGHESTVTRKLRRLQ